MSFGRGNTTIENEQRYPNINATPNVLRNDNTGNAASNYETIQLVNYLNLSGNTGTSYTTPDEILHLSRLEAPLHFLLPIQI